MEVQFSEKEASDILSCDICYEFIGYYKIPQCRNGHPICEPCKSKIKIKPPLCPQCRAPLDGRNLFLERFVSRIPEDACPDLPRPCIFAKPFGCETSILPSEMAQHKSNCAHGQKLCAEVKRGNLNEVKRIMEGVNPKNPYVLDMKDGTFGTLLHAAALFKRFEVFLYVFQSAVDKNPKTVTYQNDAINPDSCGRTPLHFAAQQGFVKIVEFLLLAIDSGKNPADENGITPLHLAARFGQHKIVQMFLERPDVLQKNPTSGSIWNGATPLHFACQSKNGTFTLKMLSFYLPKSSFFDTDQLGWTPLHYAASNGDTEILKFLLDMSLTTDDPNLLGGKSVHGMKPIHIAAR